LLGLALFVGISGLMQLTEILPLQQLSYDAGSKLKVSVN
jgi:hypothetical protein